MEINEDQIAEALGIQRKNGGTVDDILIQLGYASRGDLCRAKAKHLGMEFIDLDKSDIPTDVIGVIPANMAKVYRTIPISIQDETLIVALADPEDKNTQADLRESLKWEIKWVVASPEAVQRALGKYYAHSQESLDTLLDTMSEDGLEF